MAWLLITHRYSFIFYCLKEFSHRDFQFSGPLMITSDVKAHNTVSGYQQCKLRHFDAEIRRSVYLLHLGTSIKPAKLPGAANQTSTNRCSKVISSASIHFISRKGETTQDNKGEYYKNWKFSLQWWRCSCRWRWGVEARNPGGSLETADGSALLLETEIDLTLETNALCYRLWPAWRNVPQI